MLKSRRNAFPALLAGAGLMLALGACGGQQDTRTDANTVNAIGTGPAGGMDDPMMGNGMMDDGMMANGMMGNDMMGNGMMGNDMMGGQTGPDGNRIGATQPNRTAPTQPMGTVQPTEHQTGVRPRE